MKTTAKILYIVKRGLSLYGNPHYSAVMEDLNGNIFQARTATNASIGYGFTNPGTGNDASFRTYYGHYTAKGNLILDYSEQD